MRPENSMSQNSRKPKQITSGELKSSDALIWLGCRTAYLGDYKEAIVILSDGIEEVS